MALALTPGIDFTVGEMRLADWDAVRQVYVEGIATGNATIETDPPSWEIWDSRHLPICRYVARSGDEVLGWVALSPVSGRCAYRGVTEISVYVAARARGHRIGTALLQAVIDGSEREGIWTIQAGVFPENTASLGLHKKFGFREIGVSERRGKLNGKWRNVVLLERRSTVVGID